MPRRLHAPHAEARLLDRSCARSVELSLGSGEVSVEELAFADTVMIPDLPFDPAADAADPVPFPSDAEPPSPMSTRRPREAAPLGAQLRRAWARMGHDVRCSREEMSMLWDATADSDARLTVGRRLQRFFGFFEWQRDDVLRATWIGFAMLVLLATAAAVARSR